MGGFANPFSAVPTLAHEVKQTKWEPMGSSWRVCVNGRDWVWDVWLWSGVGADLWRGSSGVSVCGTLCS